MNEFHQEVNRALSESIKKNDLYQRYVIDSIIDKARSYNTAKLFLKLADTGVALYLAYALLVGLDALTSLIFLVILSIAITILPSTSFFAENLVIKNKDIIEVDKLDVIREIKYELKYNGK